MVQFAADAPSGHQAVMVLHPIFGVRCAVEMRHEARDLTQTLPSAAVAA
jgi:hypothetical protein